MRRATGRVPAWSEMLLLRNVAPVPSLMEEPGDTLDARGFHLVVVDRQGSATHYAKCRSADDPRALREADLLERIASTSAAPCVPSAVVVHGSRLQVIALTAIAGLRLDERLRLLTAEHAPEDVAMVLDTMARIRSAVPIAGAPSTLDAGAALAPSLAVLERVGVPAETIAVLGSAVRGTWPWQSQHGDLWPGNVIWSAQGPVLLDFEAYGEVGHPMFDAWHLVRATCHLREGRATWLDVVAPRTGSGRPWRSLLEGVQTGMGIRGNDVEAGLAWYTVRMAATLLGRGVPEKYSRGYLDDVYRVASFLSSTPRQSEP